MTVLRTCRLALVVALLGVIANVFAAPGHACACGAVVAQHGEQATLNHEVALVHWDGATETIVMQLALNATTDNVALVVPTPTPATVTAGEKATFDELDSLSAPKIQHQRRVRVGFMFAMSAPRDGAIAARAPEVVNQVHLGPLEATTLAGGDLTGLKKWLADNGYSLKPAVLDALGPYVRDGWAFVAIRLTSTAPIAGGLKPVRMTFQSSQLVYPMRLSVAATTTQRVTVFTLSDHRQQRTDADAAKQPTEVQFAGNVLGAVHDPLLRELAANHGAYLTKLAVNIPKPAQISSDFSFGNAPNDDAVRQEAVAYDYVDVPLEPIGLVIVVIAIVIFVVVRRRRRRRSGPLR